MSEVVIERPAARGSLAQLGERLICIQEVNGSIPLGSTQSSLTSEVFAKAIRSAIVQRLPVAKEKIRSCKIAM